MFPIRCTVENLWAELHAEWSLAAWKVDYDVIAKHLLVALQPVTIPHIVGEFLALALTEGMLFAA